MSNVIKFYDIPSTVPGTTWSPNTRKTIYALNYKGLAYKTVWVEYPDIEVLCKKLGTIPTEKREDGSTLHTLPAIHDPSTGAVVADAVAIAEYLDATYPDTPKLFPPGTHALQHAALNAYSSALAPLWQFAMPSTTVVLNPRSAEYFRRTKFGPALNELAPTGKLREAEWAKMREGFSVVDGWLQKGKANGPFFFGDKLCFVDCVVGGYTIWLKTIWGEDSAEWKDVASWNDGRWGAYIKALEKYEKSA